MAIPLVKEFWDVVKAWKLWPVPPIVFVLLVAIALGLLILNASGPEVPRFI